MNKHSLLSYFNIAKSVVNNRLHRVSYPSFCTFLVTWRCNAKCKMCEIWRKSNQEEMTLKQIEVLFSQLKRLDGIRISGGEPFLRSDLTCLVNIIQHKVNPSVVHITTNGLLTERIVEFVKSIDKPDRIHFKISIDAVGEKHDDIRGVRGAYKKAMDTLFALSQMRANYGFYLGIDQTIVESDTESILALRAVCNDMDIDLYQVIAYGETALYKEGDGLCLLPTKSTEITTFGEFSREELKRVLALMEESADRIGDFTERLIKRYYLRGLGNRLLWGRAKPNPMCVALNNHLRILPNGDVPICLYDSTIVGNLTEINFKELWFGNQIEKYRERVSGCAGCWAGCEVIPNAIYSGDIIRALWGQKGIRRNAKE